MTQRSETVRTVPIVSDERLRSMLRREIDRTINITRDLTRAELAASSRVNIHTIDQILSRDVAKHRRIALEDALSIAWVLGEQTVNAILATIGYVAGPLEDADVLQPMQIVAESMGHIAIIARAAADGRIDHTEEMETTEAADLLIATVLPLSSTGKRK